MIINNKLTNYKNWVIKTSNIPLCIDNPVFKHSKLIIFLGHKQCGHFKQGKYCMISRFTLPNSRSLNRPKISCSNIIFLLHASQSQELSLSGITRMHNVMFHWHENLRTSWWSTLQNLFTDHFDDNIFHLCS